MRAAQKKKNYLGEGGGGGGNPHVRARVKTFIFRNIRLINHINEPYTVN